LWAIDDNLRLVSSVREIFLTQKKVFFFLYILCVPTSAAQNPSIIPSLSVRSAKSMTVTSSDQGGVGGGGCGGVLLFQWLTAVAELGKSFVSFACLFLQQRGP
jgi:hypothetical protein